MESETNLSSMIREWWYEYYQVLRDPMNRLGNLDRLNTLTDALVENGVVRKGCPMRRDGAEDLARRCDDVRGLFNKSVKGRISR